MPVPDTGLDVVTAPAPPSDWRKLLRLDVWVVVGTFVILGGWSAVAHIDGGVVAAGQISVESFTKTIQHLEGGIVREVLVRNGDMVREGDVLVRLDPTQRDATSTAYRQQLAIARSLEARLLAQRDMREAIEFPPEVTELKDDPLVAFAVHDNQRQFETRRNGLMVSIKVLDKQINQSKQDMAQALSDQKTYRDQYESATAELNSIKSLVPKGLVPISRVTTLERTQIQYAGQLEDAKISYRRVKEKVAQLDAQIEQVRSDYRQEAATALPEVRNTLATLKQQVTISSDSLKRIEVRASNNGSVQNLRIFTVGGVIPPGGPILDLVPSSDTLVVRAKVAPVDVDRINSNARVEVRLPQFVRFQSQVIEGNVRSVSRDVLFDDVTKQYYFAVEVAVVRATIPKEIEPKLQPGMSVEIVIVSEQRTVLEFLVAPLSNRIALSMHER